MLAIRLFVISQSVIWWSFFAVLLFLSVGAHNRLVRLRSHTVRSFAALVVPMQRYADTVQSRRVNPSNPADPALDAPSHAWASLIETQVQFGSSLAVARTRPLCAAAINALAAADIGRQIAWTRVSCAGLDTFGAPLPDALRRQRSDVRQQICPAAHTFADAVKSYNTATTQFPALLLTGLFGFRTAASFPTDP